MSGAESPATVASSVEAARAPRTWVAVAWIVLAFAASALSVVHGQALARASQARAWVVARTMAETGDFAVPRYHGETRLKKPPLQSWAQAATMRAVGSTDLWAAGLGTWIVGVLFALGPWLLGRAVGKPEAGLLGSLLLCASRAATTWGGSPEHDVPFAGWVALSWAFLAVALSERGRLRHVAAAGLAAGAALLTKDPFVFAFVPGTALVLRWRPSTRGPLRSGPFWLTLLATSLLPAIAWLAVVAARLGSVGAVFDEMWRQASGSEGAHTKPLLTGLVYYLGAVPKALLPWSPIAIVATGILLVHRRRSEEAESPWLRFPVVAFVVSFVVLTIVPAKQEHYVLPALVPAALLAGQALLAATRCDVVVRRGLPWTLLAAAAAYALHKYAAGRSVAPYADFVRGFAVVLAAGVVLAFFRRTQGVGVAVACAWLMGLAGACEQARSRVVDDYRWSVDARSQSGEALAEHDATVIGFATGSGEAFDAAVAWMPNPYERVRTREALRARLARGDRVVVLVRKAELTDLGDVASQLDARGVLAPDMAESDRDRMLLFTPTGR